MQKWLAKKRAIGETLKERNHGVEAHYNLGLSLTFY